MVMPEMDGIEAMKRILEDHAKARIIMCSATGQEVLIQKAKDVGAKGFITKPFKDEDVLAAIKKALPK